MKFLRKWEDRIQSRLDNRGQCFGDDGGGGGDNPWGGAEDGPGTEADDSVNGGMGPGSPGGPGNSSGPQDNQFDENSIGIGTSGRGGNVGGISGPAGGVGVGGFGSRGGADQAVNDYEANPDAWNGANNDFGTAFQGTNMHEGLMNEIADWASRNGLVSGVGAGQTGALDGFGQMAMDYGPMALSFVNPTLGLAASLASQLSRGNYENVGKSALGALASYYGGPVAGIAANAIGNLATGNTQGAVTGALSSGINSGLGLSGPGAQAMNSLVGEGVNAVANNATFGGNPGDTGTGDATGEYSTVDVNSPEYQAMQAMQGTKPDPASPDYIKNVMDSLAGSGKKALDYASNNPLAIANGAMQLYANYQNQKAKTMKSTGSTAAGGSTIEKKMADLRANPQFRSFDVKTTPRNRIAPTGDLTTYGQTGGQHQFFDTVNPKTEFVARNYASGGAVQGALQQRTPHGVVRGEGGGQDDLVHARLSPDEYVLDADTVSALGDGSSAEGARRLDKAREALRKHKRSAPHTAIPPKAKAPGAYLKGGRK